jgi:serine/threonine protein kinase/WD40 repeat protein
MSVADPVLDAMIEDVANRLQAGGDVDLEAIARRDPERAELLRQFLPAIRMMADLGRSLVQDAAGGESSGPGPDTLGVLGDYRILREIGRGGMGIVYQAEQVSLGRRVALKVLPLAAAIDPKQLVRFQIEAQAAAHLHHTNIVPVYAVGCERGLNYYAMQFIEGPSLAAVIRELRRRDGAAAEGQLGAAGMASVMAGDLAEGRLEPARSEDATEPREGPTAMEDPHRTTDGRAPEGAGAGMRKRPSHGRAYFRAVAHLGIQAAEALDYAHRMGIVHRDIKPANVLVDVRGNLWITDFGLARMQEGSDLTMTGDLLGTLRYMSPEQALAQRIVVDYRTDIYSLGATLYELLTLLPAFDGRDRQDVLRQIASEEPRPPRRIDPAVPRELETIVQKAMTKEPSGRYATAQDLAADLRRFLADQPIRAKPPTMLERITKWARRHQAATAAAISAGAFALVTMGVGGLIIGKIQAEAARHKAQAEVKQAADRELASRRELALQAIQRTLMTSRKKGWSERAWTEVSRAVALCDVPRLQPLAVAAMVGLDAETRREFRDFGARSLAFDPKGRLLMGGVTDPRDRHKRLGARLWDGVGLQQPEELGTAADGPVGFRADGSPVQLVVGGQERTLTLVDLSRRVAPLRFQVPGALALGTGDAPPPVEMLPDGALVAAAVRVANGKPTLVVWDGLTGKVLHRFETECRCTAFSPDGAFVAAGDAVGQVVLWSMATGRAVARLDAGNRINVLSFGRSPRFSPDGPGQVPSLRRWQLAAGDGGGNVTVWDLGSEILRVRSVCRGSHNEVFALSFSPDGSMLASAGRTRARLWDPATGTLLLSMVAGTYQYGLAFSQDGRRLAIGSDEAWGSPGEVLLLELIDGRGVRTLRGLSGLIAATILSPDDRLVAALSHDWRVGVWERETGRLRLVLSVPPGLYQDNAALALSPDDRLLAYTSDRQAGLWEIETGRLLASWSLLVGLQDKLVFPGPGRLLLARAETTDPSVAPYGTDPGNYPRSCAIYDLLGKNPTVPIRRIDEMSLGTEGIALSPDGSTLVLDGYAVHRGRKVRSLDAIDLSTGVRKWTIPARAQATEYWQGHLTFDPTGKLLKALVSRSDAVLIDMVAGRSREGGDGIHSLGPGAELGIGCSSEREEHWLLELGRKAPLLAVDTATTPLGLDQFSRDGRFIVGISPLGDWVTVCDLAEIQRRLSGVGLGW